MNEIPEGDSMTWLILSGRYATGGAIAMELAMFKLGPEDPEFVRRWDRAREYLSPWFLFAVSFLTWPMVAWNFRHGKLEPDKD